MVETPNDKPDVNSQNIPVDWDLGTNGSEYGSEEPKSPQVSTVDTVHTTPTEQERRTRMVAFPREKGFILITNVLLQQKGLSPMPEREQHQLGVIGTANSRMGLIDPLGNCYYVEKYTSELWEDAIKAGYKEGAAYVPHWI